MKKFLSFLLCLVLTVSFCGSLDAKADETVEKIETGSLVAEDMIKAGLAGYTVPVIVNGIEQRFELNASDITKIKMKSQKISKDGKTLTVKAQLYIDRKVATVKTTATAKLKLKNEVWKVKDVSFKGTSIYKIPLKGTWKGTYTASQGETAVTIKVNKISKDGYITKATFKFGSTPTNKVPEGSFKLTGGYDKTTGQVSFLGDEWIKKPQEIGRVWYTIDLICFVDLNKECLTGDYSVVLTKAK